MLRYKSNSVNIYTNYNHIDTLSTSHPAIEITIKHKPRDFSFPVVDKASNNCILGAITLHRSVPNTYLSNVNK